MSKFRTTTEAALDAAADYGLVDVVVIGRDDDDEIHVWSSQTPLDAIDLIEEGSDEVESIAVNEEREARDAEKDED